MYHSILQSLATWVSVSFTNGNSVSDLSTVGISLAVKGKVYRPTRLSQTQPYRGMILSHAASRTRIDRHPPQVVENLLCMIIVMGRGVRIKKGFSALLLCHTAMPCVFTDIVEKVDKHTTKQLEANPKELAPGDAAHVVLSPFRETNRKRAARSKKPPTQYCMAAYSECNQLGRFALCYGVRRFILAVGTVKQVNPTLPVQPQGQ